MTIINTNPKPLRLGFIGGSIDSAVGYAHWAASQLDNIWQVNSGCFSRDPVISTQTGTGWNIPADKIYTQWQDYIEAEKDFLDAVVVLTPTPFHDDIVCALLAHDIPVICEKAMASTLSQSKKIQQALSSSKGFLAVTFNYSGFPMVRALRKHVVAGDLGVLKQIQIEMPSDGFIQAQEKMHPQQWRLSDGEIPTILLDLATHLHHLTSFVTNDLTPLSINADFHHDSIFENIVDDATMWVKYEQDFRASLWVSKTALGHRNGLKLHLYGDQGSALWIEEEPEKLHLFAKNSVETIYDRGNCLYPEEVRERFKPGHPTGFIEAFANLYQDIAEALVNFKAGNSQHSNYVFSWQHANEGLALFHAANLSYQQQRWILLREID